MEVPDVVVAAADVADSVDVVGTVVDEHHFVSASAHVHSSSAEQHQLAFHSVDPFDSLRETRELSCCVRVIDFFHRDWQTAVEMLWNG